MNANMTWRAPAWRNVVWVGVLASVLTWSWAWFVGRGAEAFLVFVAVAGVVFAYKAMSGMRVAMVGLLVAALVMFLSSVYFMFWIVFPDQHATAFDVLSVSVLPMVASAVLLVGAGAGYRHVNEAAPKPAAQ